MAFPSQNQKGWSLSGPFVRATAKKVNLLGGSVAHWYSTWLFSLHFPLPFVALILGSSTMPSIMLALLCICLCGYSCQGAFYLPGVTPQSFADSQSVSLRELGLMGACVGNIWNSAFQVSLKANKVTSTKTPLQFDYYDLPFCKRPKSRLLLKMLISLNVT